MLDKIRQLWEHAAWADRKILDAVRRGEEPAEDVLRELAHVIGTEEVWLSRLEERSPRTAVWPEVTRSELAGLLERTHRDFEAYLDEVSASDLTKPVTYTNSAGIEFSTPVEDILLHVALHGQYHRGKVNLLLRRAGRTPAPADYIAYVRGAPAATRT